MTEDDTMMLKAALVTAAQRLRQYESASRMNMNGPLSMVEREKAMQDAETDAACAALLEGFFRKIGPTPLAQRNGTDTVPAHGDAT